MDAQIIGAALTAAATILAAMIGYAAVNSGLSARRRLLADMDVYDKLALYLHRKWLDEDEQYALMDLRGSIGAQIRRLYLYDEARMRKWMIASFAVFLILASALSFVVRELWACAVIGAACGLISPYAGRAAYRLRVRNQDRALASLAKGPWSDAAEELGHHRYGDVGAGENPDECEETLHG